MIPMNPSGLWVLGSVLSSVFQRAAKAKSGVVESPYSVQVADMDADGKLDLVLSGLNPARAAIMLGDGNGHFREGRLVPTGNGCRSVAVADFNGDGKPDELEQCCGQLGRR